MSGNNVAKIYKFVLPLKLIDVLLASSKLLIMFTCKSDDCRICMWAQLFFTPTAQSILVFNFNY